MAFRIGTGADPIDVFICLHCRTAYYFRAGNHLSCNLSGAAVARLESVYDALFPAAEKSPPATRPSPV